MQEGTKEEYLFLVDEAHNLVERARSMYSAVLVKEDFLAVKKLVKPYSKKVAAELEKCNKILLAYKRECEVIRSVKISRILLCPDAVWRGAVPFYKKAQNFRERRNFWLYLKVRAF